MNPADLDAWHMQRVLELAVQGQGYVEPNPMVGCVIVEGAEIIGEGWHQRFGEAHAEVEALKLAGSRARGATLYVNLEPCCHQGKTPPCTKAVIAARDRPGGHCPGATPFRRWPAAGSRNAGGRHRGRGGTAGRGRPGTERPLSEAAGKGASLDHRQMGHVAGRQDRHPHRLQPVDFQRAVAGRSCIGLRGRVDAIVSAGKRPAATIRC